MRIHTTLKTLLGLAAAAAMLGEAHAQTPAKPDTRPVVSAPAAAATTMNKADQKTLTDLAMAGMAEIECAKQAQAKSQNDQVKTYAQQMINDHSKAQTDVEQLASAKGVTLPTELDKSHKAMVDKLGGMSADAIDKAYISHAVSDHQKLHAKLTQAQKKTKDPELKALIERIAPTVEQHLKAAKELASTKGAAKETRPPDSKVGT
jgi:putative membrane protein